MLLDELIELTASRLPDATALTGEGRTESFGELCTSIARLRDALAQELPPGERVAILARNIPEYVHALYAAPAAGTVLVLLNYRLHWREWATILRETETRLLLVHSELLDAVGPALADLPSLQRVAVIDVVVPRAPGGGGMEVKGQEGERDHESGSAHDHENEPKPRQR